jgi:hypothetical protein
VFEVNCIDEKPATSAGLVGERCQLQLAPTRCGETGHAEAEKPERAGNDAFSNRETPIRATS